MRNNSRAQRILLVLIVLLACAVNAYALQIVYPEDGTYVTKSNYLIVLGGSNPELDGMSISINGIDSGVIDISSAQYKSYFKDKLIVEPDLDPGKNLIEVAGFKNGKRVSRASANVYFLDKPWDVAPDNYRGFQMHVSAKEALCSSCHNMNPTPGQLAGDSAQTSPCGSCHKRMLAKEHVHGPAGVYECTYCHDGPNYSLTREEAPLCMECHEDKWDEYHENKFVHGPIEAGLCQVCHDPHASAQSAQLVAPTYDLCVACHVDITKEVHVLRGISKNNHPLRGPSNPASPMKAFHCASCHDPHGGANAALYQWGETSRFVFCQRCHKK